MEHLHIPIDGGFVPAHLTTGFPAGDILVGVGVALVLFGLYYRLVLEPARREATAQPPSAFDDTGD
ncbi:hypothetical protein ACFQL1_14285 [Halomicroarcula sp. GCM10025709]|uniref:hypothetical protein n=1 Tax=Haloarcula TaxID=2237 RepID=UPI0024C4381D|nr:hypothetical protein [Halomicroarcula sp. YJ-61-S]